MSPTWIVLFVVCWGLGAFVLRTAWQATHNQTPISGSWTLASGDRSGGGNELLGLWMIGVGLIVGPVLLYAILGGNRSGTSSATSTTSTSSATPGASSPTPGPALSSEYRFATADDNIACVMRLGVNGEAVRCDIQTKTWTAPPKPADCGDTWGNTLQLNAQGASLLCVENSVLRDRTVLREGESTTVGGATCASTADGVECTLRGHGFRLSPAAYEVF